MAQREMTPTGNGRRGMMTLARDPFSMLKREMDRLFDDFFVPPTAGAVDTLSHGTTWPSLDIEENDTAYMVTAELPGLEQKDVELNLRDNILTISGEKRSEHKDEAKGRSYVERSYGSFMRSIPFETEIDADKIDATFKNGVLSITLPKSVTAREKARRIEIH